MLLSEAECKITLADKPQGKRESPAVVDLRHADTHFVRNSGGPSQSFTGSQGRRYGEG